MSLHFFSGHAQSGSASLSAYLHIYGRPVQLCWLSRPLCFTADVYFFLLFSRPNLG